MLCCSHRIQLGTQSIWPIVLILSNNWGVNKVKLKKSTLNTSKQKRRITVFLWLKMSSRSFCQSAGDSRALVLTVWPTDPRQRILKDIFRNPESQVPFQTYWLRSWSLSRSPGDFPAHYSLRNSDVWCHG